MKLKRIPVGDYAANCYIFADDTTNEGAVIDPGYNSSYLADEINKTCKSLKYIFITHGHSDHIGAVADLKKIFNVPVCINERDVELITKNEYMFGPAINLNKTDIFITDGDTFKVGKYTVKCFETPGHTPGGVCFLVDGLLFSGDTLFKGSVGRTDFPGGDMDMLMKSIKTKILPLDDDIVVLPGHGPESTMKYERSNNPFL